MIRRGGFKTKGAIGTEGLPFKYNYLIEERVLIKYWTRKRTRTIRREREEDPVRASSRPFGGDSSRYTSS
jgi:hypothetical protein